MAYPTPSQNFWEPQMRDLQTQMHQQARMQAEQQRQNVLQNPAMGMDSHSGIRFPGYMSSIPAYAPQATPKQVVPNVPQPTPTTTSAFQREMATQNYANEPVPGQNNLASILAGLFGFMK